MDKPDFRSRQYDEVHSVAVGGSGTMHLIEFEPSKMESSILDTALFVVGLNEEKTEFVYSLFINGFGTLSNGQYSCATIGNPGEPKYIDFRNVDRDEAQELYSLVVAVMNNLSARLGTKNLLDERFSDHKAMIQDVASDFNPELVLTRKANAVAAGVLEYLIGKGCVITTDAEKGLPEAVKNLLGKSRSK